MVSGKGESQEGESQEEHQESKCSRELGKSCTTSYNLASEVTHTTSTMLCWLNQSQTHSESRGGSINPTSQQGMCQGICIYFKTIILINFLFRIEDLMPGMAAAILQP